MEPADPTLARELRAHLVRLTLWSVFGVGLGLAVVALRSDPAGRSFGIWTAGWCVVNLVIVAASWWGRPPARRDRFREFLMLNLGLNAGYLGVGAALALAAVSSEVRAAGVAVAIQGFALLVLDGWLVRRVPSAPEGV